MADLVLSAWVIIIIMFLLVSSTHDAIEFEAKTYGHVLSIKNAYGFTYKPSTDNNSNNNRNLTIEKFQQIKDIQASGLPFSEYIHKISIGAANPLNITAIKDYKAIQKDVQKIDKLIDGCDVKKDFITSSVDATDLCMNYSSFVYETCAGDHNIYPYICNNTVIEAILKTTKPSSEELNRRAYNEARISVPLEYRK
jgi:hypothetical protein